METLQLKRHSSITKASSGGSFTSIQRSFCSPSKEKLSRPLVSQLLQTSCDVPQHLDSSDTSDTMDDKSEAGGERRTPTSKNLISERKRRRNLNEKLYSLRALVPNISKMDKASIVNDAITHVQDLQKRVSEVEAHIADLESRKEGAAMACSGAEDPRRTEPTFRYQKKVKQEHKLLELEVSRMEEHIYHLRIHCKKSASVLVQLTRALEALQFEILNANLSSVDDHILNTAVVEVKDGPSMHTDVLREMILSMLQKYGFCF